MREFVIKEEEFRLKYIEKVPEPQKGECFLLYQEGAGAGKSKLISRGIKYSATAVRHGKYNKKVIFALQKKTFQHSYHIFMADTDFYFVADVSINYEIQDVKKYFFGNIMDEDTLQNITRRCANDQNKKWQLKQGWELQNALENNIEQKVKQFDGVRFQVVVDVKPDDAAQKILESDKKTKVDIHTSGNEKDVQIAANTYKAAIAESERALKLNQINELKMLIKDFGVLASVANDYLAGKLNGVEFYNYIMKSKTDNMNILNMAAASDMLTTEEFMAKVNDILTNRQFGNIDNNQLSGKEESKLEMHPDEEQNTEGKEEEETDILFDGGFV